MENDWTDVFLHKQEELRERRETRRIRTEIPYPYNLAEMISEQNITGYGKLNFTSRDILRLVAGTLSPREQQVVEFRWRDGMTLEEIGKAIGVTRERVRQVEAKAMRKLLRPRLVVKYSSVPYECYEAERREREKLQKQIETLLSKVTFTTDKSPDTLTTSAASVSLADLDLSVRSYNVLGRYGCRTLADVIKINEDDFYHIRNLGRRSAEEIINKVHSFGEKMAWEV